MKKQLFTAILFVAVTTLVLNLPTTAQKKGKTRPMTTSHLMAGLVKPRLTLLKGSFEKKELSDDA